ncbi:hypothetical protein BHM03_00031714 [Ensete ventricosum]|nr:hypothetical protein BHM03_00031714 [Ensete ventricosum]
MSPSATSHPASGLDPQISDSFPVYLHRGRRGGAMPHLPESWHTHVFFLSPLQIQISLSTKGSSSQVTMASLCSYVTDLDSVFHSFDKDGDGKISAAELTACMRNMGEELSLEDAEAFVELADRDGDGLLDLKEFVKLVEVEGEEERDRDLRAAFKMYEDEGDGCITPGSLKRMLSRLGTSRGIEECRTMICRIRTVPSLNRAHDSKHR